MKKSLLPIISLFFLVFLQNCKDEEPGYNQLINPIWEHRFDVGLTTGIAPVVANDKVLYSSLVKVSVDYSDNDKLIAFDKKDGEKLWEWSDHFSETYQHFSESSIKPIYNNIIAITIGGRNFAINLEEGRTVWKNRNENTTSRNDLGNLSSRLFRTDICFPEDCGEYVDRIMEGDFYTGSWWPIYEVRGADTLRPGLQLPTFYFEPDGDTVMVFNNTELDPFKILVYPRLISYNKTKKELYYDILLDEPGTYNAVDWFPVIEGDRVYLAVNRQMMCVNLYTGERIWATQMSANILSSNFILVDDRIYANVEGLPPMTYCFNAQNGNVIWTAESVGIGSHLYHYNGVLYYAGGTVLRMVDADNGKLLASIRAPSSYKHSEDYFSGRMTLDPETGYIYAVSQSTAYCYPPLR